MAYQAKAKNKANCLEGNTMRNRGAYSTKERMPSDSKHLYQREFDDLHSLMSFSE